MMTKSNSLRLFSVVLMLVLIPFCTPLALGDVSVGIEKDVLFELPIQGPEDLPDAVTLSLYDSEDAPIPLATQTFPRGEYVLEFDFNQSDGLSSASVARFKVDFTGTLNLDNALDSDGQPQAIWLEIALDDAVRGSRERLTDETMVQLLMDSDASIASYLTLAYQGDGNPFASIYKELPLPNSSGSSTFSYFDSVVNGSNGISLHTNALSDPNNWYASGNNIYYSYGNVGIMTTTPDRDLAVKYSSASGSLHSLPAISVANTNTSGLSFSSYEFSGGNGVVVGEFFADGSGHFLGGTPNVYFRASTDSPILLGTNKQIRMIITNDGKVGIGTTNPGAYNLAVDGSIRAKSLRIDTGWADFVFEPQYQLPALVDVADFISRNGHLPGIPSATEVEKDGISVGEISSKLLQKIEELTLYVIDLKKENDTLKTELDNIQKRIEE